MILDHFGTSAKTLQAEQLQAGVFFCLRHILFTFVSSLDFFAGRLARSGNQPSFCAETKSTT